MRQTLQERYDKIVSTYIQKFASKQDIYFEGWVGEHVGSIACFNDMFFDFLNIKIDIDCNIPSGLIVDWYNSSLDKAIIEGKESWINYKTYLMGMNKKGYNYLKAEKL